MSDYINKIITLILIFVMLVIGPLTFSYLSDEMTSQRMILNEVTEFLDKITDQGSVSSADLDDFYLAINSHGLVLDAKVENYRVVAEPGVEGDKRNSYYFMVDDFKELGTDIDGDGTIGDSERVRSLLKKDIIKVHIEEMAVSPGRRLMYYVLRVDTGKYALSMSAAVN